MAEKGGLASRTTTKSTPLDRTVEAMKGGGADRPVPCIADMPDK